MDSASVLSSKGLKDQRSHLLFVLSNSKAGRESDFVGWYLGDFRNVTSDQTVVIKTRQFQKHEVDITGGRWPPPPFQYLSIFDLALDGAEAAKEVIDLVSQLHNEQPSAEPPSTWMYYPAGEKVGRPPKSDPSMLTIAFANGLEGQQSDFREWYVTRHIRHALVLPAFVSGQCFERTNFQQPGSLKPEFHLITMYEQEGTPEEILESMASLPQDALLFPALDLTRFGESVYRPLSNTIA